jgi:hypothetical protein
VQLQQGCATGIGRPLGVDRLLQFSRQVVDVLGFAQLQGVAEHLAQIGLQAGGRVGALDAPALVDPAQALEFGVLVDHGLGTQMEFLQAQLRVRDIACNTHELFLALQQTQAQALLGVLDIPFHGFLLAVDLLQAQVTKGRNDGGKKQHHGCQRRKHGQPVLALRGQMPPPAPDAFRRRDVLFACGWGVCGHGRSVGDAGAGLLPLPCLAAQTRFHYVD